MNNGYKILLDISNEDLNASKLLFENCFYPQALFYFQQSVEKLIKYLGLVDGIIKPEDLRKKISHNSSVIFKRAMSKYKYLDSSNNDINVDNEFQDLKNIINNISESKVLDVILDKILETVKGESFNVEQLKSLEEFYEEIREINPNIPKLNEIINGQSFNQTVQNEFQIYKSELEDNIKGIAILFYINIVTERLVSSVRYPDPDKMINPSEKYCKNSSLISQLPTLFNAFEFSYEVVKSR